MDLGGSNASGEMPDPGAAGAESADGGSPGAGAGPDQTGGQPGERGEGGLAGTGEGGQP